jgi:hypothetical protein
MAAGAPLTLQAGCLPSIGAGLHLRAIAAPRGASTRPTLTGPLAGESPSMGRRSQPRRQTDVRGRFGGQHRGAYSVLLPLGRAGRRSMGRPAGGQLSASAGASSVGVGREDSLSSPGRPGRRPRACVRLVWRSVVGWRGIGAVELVIASARGNCHRAGCTITVLVSARVYLGCRVVSDGVGLCTLGRACSSPGRDAWQRISARHPAAGVCEGPSSPVAKGADSPAGGPFAERPRYSVRRTSVLLVLAGVAGLAGLMCQMSQVDGSRTVVKLCRIGQHRASGTNPPPCGDQPAVG